MTTSCKVKTSYTLSGIRMHPDKSAKGSFTEGLHIF